MHPFLKWSLAVASLAVVLAALVPAIVWLESEAVIERRYPLPSTTVVASEKAKAIARGAHLVLIAGCSDCHGADLEGRLLHSGSILPVWSSNLRLLTYRVSDGEIERAIRTGIAPDSTSLWLMPAMDYTYMSEDDVVAIVSYLHTIPAHGQPVPKTEFGLRARFAIESGDIEPIAERTMESPSSLDLGSRYDGGHYLTRVACGDCHGADLTGSADASDLTSVSHYDRAHFFTLLRTGAAVDGRRIESMARPRFRALYDYEIDALYDYLSARAKALGRNRAQAPRH